MSTYTLVNTTDVLTNTDWTFDASNFLVGAATTGITIGAPTGGDVSNSVNVAGGFYINDVSIFASPTFSGTVTITTAAITTLNVSGVPTLSDGLVVTGQGVKFGAPTGGQPATAGQVNGTAYLQNNVNIASGKATEFATPSSPTAPNSTSTTQMQGLAGSITPTVSGKVLITICAVIGNATGTANDGIRATLSYGTGVAPGNNTALAGTQIGNAIAYRNPTTVTAADVAVPFSITGVITGLTLGTAYWLDLAAIALNTASSCNLFNVTISAVEV